MEAYCKISAVITAFGDVFGDFPVIRFFLKKVQLVMGFLWSYFVFSSFFC